MANLSSYQLDLRYSRRHGRRAVFRDEVIHTCFTPMRECDLVEYRESTNEMLSHSLCKPCVTKILDAIIVRDFPNASTRV